MLVGIVWCKPNFQKFFNAFKEMAIIDNFIFRHPAIAISSVSLLVCFSVSKTQIIRFVIYLYRFFTNHFLILVVAAFNCLFSFNRNKINFPIVSPCQMKFSMGKKLQRPVRRIRFFFLLVFSHSSLVGSIIISISMCVCMYSDFTARERGQPVCCSVAVRALTVFSLLLG